MLIFARLRAALAGFDGVFVEGMRSMPRSRGKSREDPIGRMLSDREVRTLLDRCRDDAAGARRRNLARRGSSHDQTRAPNLSSPTPRVRPSSMAQFSGLAGAGTPRPMIVLLS